MRRLSRTHLTSRQFCQSLHLPASSSLQASRSVASGRFACEQILQSRFSGRLRNQAPLVERVLLELSFERKLATDSAQSVCCSLFGSPEKFTTSRTAHHSRRQSLEETAGQTFAYLIFRALFTAAKPTAFACLLRLTTLALTGAFPLSSQTLLSNLVSFLSPVRPYLQPTFRASRSGEPTSSLR